MTPQERVIAARRHIADMEWIKQEYPHLASTLQPLILECERQIQDLIDAHAPKRRSHRAAWVWAGLILTLAAYAGIGVLIALGV